MYTTVVLYDKWFVKCIQYSTIVILLWAQSSRSYILRVLLTLLGPKDKINYNTTFNWCAINLH